MPHPDLIRLLLTSFALLSLAGMVKRPFWGVISYLMIMMLRPGLYYPILARFRIELLIGLLVIFFIFATGKYKKINITEDHITKWMFLLFGIMVLSMIQAMDFSTSWERMNAFFKILLFIIMIVALTETKQDCEILLLVFCLLTAMIAYESIFNYLTGNLVVSLDTSKRMTYAKANDGMGSGHVALANMCNQALSFAWYVGACHKNTKVKFFGCILFIVLLSGVVISGSKGGFIGLGAFFLCLILFSKNKLKMSLLVFGAFCTIGIVNPEYLNFMEKVKIIGSTDVSANSRITGLIHGFQMLLRRPLLGVGPGCYPVARRAWFGWGLWSHNLYGQIMGDLGLLGVLAFYKFVSYYLKRAFQLKNRYVDDWQVKNICNAIIVGTIVRLFMGMGSHCLYIFFWYLLAGVLIALSYQFGPIQGERSS
jgi:hypothetical protein